MPEHTELEIDSVISRQNVAKEGWTTYYVDGTNGNDANNGLRWETAFKTIQHAIDVTESWGKIYIRSGTYAENVDITKNNIVLIGEFRDSVIIHPSSGYPVCITGNNCFITSVSLIVPNHDAFCVFITGDYAKLDNLKLDGVAGSGGILAEGSDEVIIRHIFASNSHFTEGISLALGTSRVEVSHNVLNLTYSGVGYVLYLDDVSNSKIFENDFGALPNGWGLFISNNASDLTIFHNNFLDNNTQVENYGTNISLFENYFNDHSNVDNGFGIATEPYVFTGGSDPRPVVCMNGWLGLGIGGNTIKSVPVAGTYTHLNDTTEHDVLEFSAATQDIHISLDVSALTQPVEVREYEKIDGTNYRQISLKTYPDDFDTGTDAITIYFKQKNKDYKVTLKSTASEGASRDIPYVYRTDGKV